VLAASRTDEENVHLAHPQKLWRMVYIWPLSMPHPCIIE
jgi:hypothetical protein